MTYYLPITVNKRRLHVCELTQLKDGVVTKPIYSFLINNNGHDTTLVSIENVTPKLISTDGWSKDVHLANFYTSITKENNNYVLTLLKNKPEKEKQECEGLVVEGGFNNSDNFFKLHKDSTCAKLPNPIVLTIRYVSENATFEYCIKFYVYQNDELIEAAIDFGSEASQIYVEEDNNNLQLVDKFKHYYTKLYPGEIDFWQGQSNDRLFKSVFFLHTEPGKTCFTDSPGNNDNKTFIQCLLPKTHTDYSQLISLPNLKLVELLPLDTWSQGIGGEHPFNSATIALSHKDVFPGILRIILNNFMYCILHHKVPRKQQLDKTTNKFLRIILLMPNVYHQAKISSIIKNMYLDFEKIVEDNPEFNSFKGIEIQVLSESDAAFLGARKAADTKVVNAANEHFLIIDAGKGTTDFSILKQYDIYSKYDSIYRSGIPASGHIMTYAFYEALRDYLNLNIITLNDKLSDDSISRAKLLEFMDCLERFKIRYDNIMELQEIKKLPSVPFERLSDVITFLNNLLNNNLIFPGLEKKINEKVNELVLEIYKSISKAKIKNFEQVLLTGRGFLFKPLRNGVVKMLTENGYVGADKIIAYEGSLAKSICVKGAFSGVSKVQINENSELIGRPVISEQESATEIRKSKKRQKIKEMISILVNKNKKNMTSLDKEFFYNGIKTSHKNIQIELGNATYTADNKEEGIVYLYFSGNGFILQRENESEVLNENEAIRHNFVLQTLFPYHPGSIAEKEQVGTTNQLEEKKEKGSEKPKNKEIEESTKNEKDESSKSSELIKDRYLK